MQNIFIDALWVLGLTGLLATWNYINWYRQIKKWDIRYTLMLPLTLCPLNASFALFCLGLTLNSVFAEESRSWWEIAAWAILFILFLAQSILSAMAGKRRGWHVP